VTRVAPTARRISTWLPPNPAFVPRRHIARHRFGPERVVVRTGGALIAIGGRPDDKYPRSAHANRRLPKVVRLDAHPVDTDHFGRTLHLDLLEESLTATPISWDDGVAPGQAAMHVRPLGLITASPRLSVRARI